jgi:hypothetical protein
MAKKSEKSDVKNINISIGAKNTDKIKECCTRDNQHCKNQCGPSGAIYGLGFLGAAIYFISVATSFWMGVLGVLKAIVWPVFLVFGLLKFLGL